MADAYKNVKVPLSYGDGTIQVGYNYGGEPKPTYEREAVYIEFREEFGSISVDDAVIIRDKMTEIIDAYVAARPKPLSDREFWEKAAVGTFARQNNNLLHLKLNKTEVVYSLTTAKGGGIIEKIAHLSAEPGSAQGYEIVVEGR